MNKHFVEFNHQLTLIQNDKDIPLGLFYGKMGLCIYFYHLGRIEGDEKYTKVAEQLIDDIFAEIAAVSTIDLESGLSGIGVGISYLIKMGYVEGEENVILRDIDNEIFKRVSFKKLDDNVPILIQVLFYIYIRKQSLLGEQEYLFNELTIHIINNLHAKIEYILKDDTLSFDLNANLPLFLFVLGKIYALDICRCKIIKIIHEITPFLLSKYGFLNSKRLHLLWGIDNINTYIKDKYLTEYSALLAKQINFDDLFNEFRNKNVFMKNGISGICLLMLSLSKNEKQNLDANAFYIKALERIEKSLVWESFSNTEYLKNHIGLSGYCGVNIIMHIIKSSI